MEKNTLLAILLSMAVLVIFYVVQGVFFPPAPAPVRSVQTAPPAESAPAPVQLQAAPGPIESAVETSSASAIGTSGIAEGLPESGPLAVQYVTIDTELITVVLSSAGGNVVSWKLKEHFDKDGLVEMIFSGSSEAKAFSIALGGLDAQPVSSFFHVNRLSPYSVEFYRDFAIPSGGIFRMAKRYDFKPQEYMFELTVVLDGGHSVQGFNFGGSAYTLAFGPQIGPKFEKLDNRNEYRQYVTFTNGKRKEVKLNEMIDSRPSWAAISGKYFSLIAIPYPAHYNISFSDRSETGVPSASRLNIIRPAASTSRIQDTYRFYLGPKTQDALVVYNTGKNDFGLMDAQLLVEASTRGVLAPLERILKWFLMTFHKLIPNYGIAIILLTLFVKIVFFPLTKKSSEATLRMQALAPKIKELQAKHKGNPQKLNAEMAAFYKQEGYNPITGCLPMLLQLPIFIAMYNLFNSHFDLRNAEFIPVWIPDLSLPESVWEFPDGFRLPFLGWNALRILPFIYVGSQLLYGKLTQIPGQQSNSQMKMMLYVMPIVFFFILYDMPSGLLIYWIFSNLLTLVQQMSINKYLVRKKAAAAESKPPEPVIAPRKKKK